MDGQMRRVLGDSICLILVRQSDEESRRTDADLAGEADQATGSRAAGARGDDEHRIVQHGDKLLEGFHRYPVARVGVWPESTRPPTPSICPSCSSSLDRDITWCSQRFD